MIGLTEAEYKKATDLQRDIAALHGVIASFPTLASPIMNAYFACNAIPTSEKYEVAGIIHQKVLKRIDALKAELAAL